ncbi:uncharacterized protein TNCV_4636301 [Trichonephila clavipes]|uniref:Uncharacterized protein n=1 Tax=Trichonephila clavipes TaxID=2585209 RepID=A0A8X6V0J8_TRICX|nr:uncharacterized protein TNCV_4636301 [Trichonephila clavipes]
MKSTQQVLHASKVILNLRIDSNSLIHIRFLKNFFDVPLENALSTVALLMDNVTPVLSTRATLKYYKILSSDTTPITDEKNNTSLASVAWSEIRGSVFTLADGAKQSFSLRGKNRLRIFTLRLTGGAHRYHCSRRKQKPTSDINKVLTGGAQRTSLNQSPGDLS